MYHVPCTILYQFDIEKKILKGYWKFFVCANASKLDKELEYIFQKFKFFFHMLFWGSAKPSFGWYKVTKNSYEATTTQIMLAGAPKLGT